MAQPCAVGRAAGVSVKDIPSLSWANDDLNHIILAVMSFGSRWEDYTRYRVYMHIQKRPCHSHLLGYKRSISQDSLQDVIHLDRGSFVVTYRVFYPHIGEQIHR